MSEPVPAQVLPPGWSLQRAIDALADAAAQAGRPSFLWLAGLVYPGWWWVYWNETRVDLRGLPQELGLSASFQPLPILLLVIGLAMQRLTAGLARIAHPPDWKRASGPTRSSPRLRAAWNAGSGSTLSATGLYVLLGGMQLAVGFFFGNLTLALRGGGWSVGPSLLLLSPVWIFLVAYATVLMVLHQLALHSLVHNRRGVGSALTHAWRIARHDPAATFRAVLCELVLVLFIAGVGGLLVLVRAPGVSLVLLVALGGFAGTTRAAFWARGYRALGGLSPADGVPGLAGEPRTSPTS